MEEKEPPKQLAEQPPEPANDQNECSTATSQERPAQSCSQRVAPICPDIDSSSLPLVPPSNNSSGERARWSARGEPALHISQPAPGSALAMFQHITSALGQINEHQNGILRELQVMRREMRLMRGEQRRTNTKVLSMAHNLEILKEHIQQHDG